MAIYETEIVDKVNDENTANDATLNDDSDLKFAMKANEVYSFEVYAHYIAGAGGIQCAMSGPAGFTKLHYSANLDVAGATKVSSNLATAWDVTVLLAGASQGMVRIIGNVHNGATPGNLVFRWAQNASNPANTTIHEDSWIRVNRLA